jgi:hypothetical protein
MLNTPVMAARISKKRKMKILLPDIIFKITMFDSLWSGSYYATRLRGGFALHLKLEFGTSRTIYDTSLLV